MGNVSISSQIEHGATASTADSSARRNAPAEANIAERPIIANDAGQNNAMSPDITLPIGRDSDAMIWNDPSTWLPPDPIDTDNAKYSIRPGIIPITTIYSNDGINWYRQRTIINPRSWFYDPYNIDHRYSDAIKDVMRIQDEAREQGVTPEPVNICFHKMKAATVSSTEKAGDIDCKTIAPKLAPEEDPSGIWGIVGRKPLNRDEISRLPAIAPARAIYGGYADLITIETLKALFRALVSRSED